MKAGSVWFGVVLVAVGVCGLLDAAGVVDSSQTIGQWWPLAVIGLAAGRDGRGETGHARRRHLRGRRRHPARGCAAWAGDVVVWSSLAAFTGAGILVAAAVRGHGEQTGSPINGGTPVNGAAS